MKALSLQFAAVALFTVFASTPAQAACSKESCGPIGPPLGACAQVVSDNLFDDTTCGEWQSTGYVFLRSEGSDRYYDLYARSGTLYQDVGELPYPNFEVRFTLEVLNRSTAGSERLIVELIEPGVARLATIATLYPSTSDKTYTFRGSYYDFANKNARLYFRLNPGSTPGDTYFRIRSVYLWSLEQ